ncbi:MAG TPA: LysM peptidoglycan-binding domain-containing protein [Gemmatirosa sp.]
MTSDPSAPDDASGSNGAGVGGSAAVLPPRHTSEFRVYAPGEAIDAPPLADTVPERGLLPRRRSRLQRILIGLSSGTLLLVVVAVLALATTLSPPGAQRIARAAAEQELASELDPSERVLARAYVSQRLWSDNLRESFGLLAATDRRLVFVGEPPAAWIRRHDGGPAELRVQSFPYDVPFTADAQRLLLGTSPGVVVRTPASDVPFLVPRGERAHARDIERVVERALVARTSAGEREQQARVAPAAPAPVYGVHVVHSGEAVTTIARAYHTTPDVVRQLNRLPNDRIRIGQRLRVPLASDSASAAGTVAGAQRPTGRAPTASAY